MKLLFTAIKPCKEKNAENQQHTKRHDPTLICFLQGDITPGIIRFKIQSHIAWRSTLTIALAAMTQSAQSMTSSKINALRARIDRPIALVGLMGVGKSSVGRRLAAVLDRDFVDADEEIEKAAQRTVSEIFEEFGEASFRDGERRVIARLIEEKRGVIATGGGAFVDDETRSLILDQAIAVWIDCSIETLVERTSRRDTRPLLKTGDPHEILSRLASEREPFYSQSPIRVESKDGPHEDTVTSILEGLNQWQ